METTFYTKDFDGWNIQKKGLENKISDLFFPRSRQVWYVKIGINV
jgi:hypothetical protein